MEQVHALADISCSLLCCHSNETHALIVNLPNNAQLDGTPYHSPKLHLGPCSSVGMRQGTERQTDKQTYRQHCCHGKETHAPIANPPNSAQLEGTPYHSPNLHTVRVVWECGEGHTDTQP